MKTKGLSLLIGGQLHNTYFCDDTFGCRARQKQLQGVGLFGHSGMIRNA